MPLGAIQPQKFTTPKQNIIRYNSWRKGWNTFLRDVELAADELTQSTNLLLIGAGIPTKRWGSQNSFLAGATGYGRFLASVKDANDNIQVLGMTDWGILVKQNNASYTQITGVSWPSGYNTEAAQLAGNLYLVNSQVAWAKYIISTGSLISFHTLAIPTGVAVTNLSLATGLSTWSWKVTSLGRGGETTASTAVSLASLPGDAELSKSLFRITWTAISAASGDLTGYNVYRGSSGNEVFIGGVDSTITSFDDVGISTQGNFKLAPTTDTSGGPNAKYIVRYKDRLILAGIPGAPTKVIISAPYPNQEKFDWFSQGGYISIEPDSGEDITGLSVFYRSATSTQTIVVFKEHSVWELSLDTVAVGPYIILNPTYRLLTLSQGCASHRSIAQVENELMFVNERGVYILRYEPQLLNVINANELSAKIRPFFQGLTYADIQKSAAIYADKKYIIAFPVSQQIIMFDRQRLCFMGPWTPPFGIAQWVRYFDSTNIEHWLAIDNNDSYVSEFKPSYVDDKGTAMRTVFKTKKEDFGDWTIFKTINELYMNFRNVFGNVSVNIYLEQRNGAVVVAKSLTITGSSSGTSGFGSDEFGLAEFGLSNNNPALTTVESPKRTFLFKTARYAQIEIITTGNSDSYQLLGLLLVALPQVRGMAPTTWNV